MTGLTLRVMDWSWESGTRSEAVTPARLPWPRRARRRGLPRGRRTKDWLHLLIICRRELECQNYDYVKSLPSAKLAMHTLSERREEGERVEECIVIFNKVFISKFYREKIQRFHPRERRRMEGGSYVEFAATCSV